MRTPFFLACFVAVLKPFCHRYLRETELLTLMPHSKHLICSSPARGVDLNLKSHNLACKFPREYLYFLIFDFRFFRVRILTRSPFYFIQSGAVSFPCSAT